MDTRKDSRGGGSQTSQTGFSKWLILLMLDRDKFGRWIVYLNRLTNRDASGFKIETSDEEYLMKN